MTDRHEPERRENNNSGRRNTDHDLLMKHTVKLDTMCSLQRDMTKKLDAFIDKIDLRCQDRFDRIVGGEDLATKQVQEVKNDTVGIGTFWKILSVLIFVLALMTTAISYNRILVLKNSVGSEKTQTAKNTKLYIPEHLRLEEMGR